MEILTLIATGAAALLAVELYGMELDRRQYRRAAEEARLERLELAARRGPSRPLATPLPRIAALSASRREELGLPRPQSVWAKA